MTGASPRDNVIRALTINALANIGAPTSEDTDGFSVAWQFASTVLSHDSIPLVQFGDNDHYGYQPAGTDAWFALQYRTDCGASKPNVVIAAHLPSGERQGTWQIWLAPSGTTIVLLDGRMQSPNVTGPGHQFLRRLLDEVRLENYTNKVLEGAFGSSPELPSARMLAQLLARAALNLGVERDLVEFRRPAGSFYGLAPRGLIRTYLGLGIVQPNDGNGLRVCLCAWVAFGCRRGQLQIWIDSQNQPHVTRNGRPYPGQDARQLETFVTMVAAQVLHPWARSFW
jgi:hypothetical protein